MALTAEIRGDNCQTDVSAAAFGQFNAFGSGTNHHCVMLGCMTTPQYPGLTPRHLKNTAKRLRALTAAPAEAL